MHKIFPSAPRIPWKIGCSSRVIPQLPSDLWNKILSENQNIQVVAYGGFLETFYSLSLLEILNFYHPHAILYWSGREEFFDLVKMNGLAKLSKNLEQHWVRKIPTPIFSDQDFLYFNALFNYLNFFSYKGKFTYKNKELVIKQIFNNICLENLPSIHLPKLRKTQSEIPTYDVLICPYSLNISQHSGDSLAWSVENLQILPSYLKSRNISYAIVTNNNKFVDVSRKIISPSITELLYLISKTRFLLAKEIDLLLIALSISSAKIFFTPLKDKRFCLKKHAFFLRGEEDSVINLNDITFLELDKIISNI